jgi:hypothetical protein
MSQGYPKDVPRWPASLSVADTIWSIPDGQNVSFSLFHTDKTSEEFLVTGTSQKEFETKVQKILAIC